ncbi:MAG: SpoIIE family protein phosphatase, partial [Chloroflexaceae bacterium]|nr:SpoIIE family protein phosphatase [Chloroflexaceae bacterium]
MSLGVQKVRLLEERERQVQENKRLLVAEQAARRTADTLREVARVLSASFDDLDEVLNLILAELNNVIPYDSASLMLRENGRLRVVACQGWPPDQQPSGFRFQPHDMNVVQVMDAGLPVIIEDTASNPYWISTPYSAHVRAWLGVPLVSRGQAFGILSIDSRQLQRFSQRDAEVALAFASQAAVALENARLFQESVTRVEQEMEIAREIQSHLFPQTLPEVPGMELAACCLPARETGGDFYDLISLDEGRLGVVVGDVSGKSLPAAMLMAVARSVARSESRHHDSTSDMLHATNRLIAQDVPPHTFVALTYASFDSASRLLTVSNAGQLTPLVRRADGSVSHLDAFAAFPLGIVKDVRYREQLVTLDGGDVVIFYTDGIVEAKNSQGELFGFERLEALLTTCGDTGPQQLIDTIIAAVNSFTGPVPRHDDMT